MFTSTNRVFLGVALAAGLASLPALAAAQASAPAGRPNIIVIMADDMGFSDVGAYGGEIRTPHLDALAAGGVRFSQFYNNAKCSPTRASLLTGLHSARAGMAGGPIGRGDEPEAGAYQGFLPANSVTIAEALGAVGYRTYMTGKWHLGEDPKYWPRQRGFDRYFGLISGATSFFELLQEPGRPRQMVLEDSLWTPPASGFYATDAYTDYAVDRIREHSRRHASQPFFLYLAYTAPHFPLHALPEDIARYKGRYDIGWDSIRAQRYARQRRSGIVSERHALAPRPPSVPAWETVADRETWTRRMEVYAAMVDRMDQGIGRLVAALGETGMRDNTLILFLSDNGASAESMESRKLNRPGVPMGARGSYATTREPWAYASNTPFRLYKTGFHEGGVASPLIASWPRGIRTPGRVAAGVGHVTDILPTALEVAGARYPATRDGLPTLSLDGRSLAAALRGEPLQPRRAPIFWTLGGDKAVRDGDWKLVFDPGRSKGWTLYDLASDPTELRDLYGAQPARARALTEAWEAWSKRVGLRAGGGGDDS